LNIEKVVINQLLKNKEYRSTAISTILEVPFIFKDHNYNNIIKFMKMFYEEKKIAPTKDDLLLYLENETSLNEKDYKAFKSTLKDIVKAKFEFTMNNLKEQTLKFIKDNLSMVLFEKAADVLNGVNKKDSLENLQSDMRKIVDLDFDDDIGLFLDDTYQFKDYGMNVTPLGFEPIDKLLGGGLPEATMTVILSGPHVGKSLTKMFLAVQSAMLGKKVTYVSGEMRTNMTRQRIDSIALRIATTRLTPKEMEYVDYIALWKEARKTVTGNINIKYFPSSSCDANRVAKHLQDLENKYSYKTDLLIIDSINLMRPIDRKITKLQKHIWMESLTIDFREMIDDENVSLLTSAQLNREGMKALKDGEDPSMENIGEFFMLGGFADAIIGLKKLYRDDDMLFNDYNLNKPLDETMNNEIDLSGMGVDYYNIVKMNIIKTRFGTVVGTYILIGSNEKYSSLVDLNSEVKKKIKKSLKKLEEVKDKISEKADGERKEFRKEHGAEVETYKKKRRHI